MEKQDVYECFLSKDKKKLYYLNGKRIAASGVPTDIKKNLPCLSKEKEEEKTVENTKKVPVPFRIEGIKDILKTWRVPMDLFAPLSKYYKSTVNDLENLLELFPDKPWNWELLSENPNVTWEFVQRHPEMPWSWVGLSKNPSITWEIIQRSPEKPWVWRGIIENPNTTWDMIQNDLGKCPWYQSSKHRKLILDTIRGDWEKSQSRTDISINYTITWEVVQGSPDIPFRWYGFSKNPNLTWEMVYDNKDKEWSWYGMSSNKFQRK